VCAKLLHFVRFELMERDSLLAGSSVGPASSNPYAAAQEEPKSTKETRPTSVSNGEDTNRKNLLGDADGDVERADEDDDHAEVSHTLSALEQTHSPQVSRYSWILRQLISRHKRWTWSEWMVSGLNS